jgi:hypothetical protein
LILPGSQSPIQLGEGILYQIFREIVIGDRPNCMPQKLRAAVIKERRFSRAYS